MGEVNALVEESETVTPADVKRTVEKLKAKAAKSKPAVVTGKQIKADVKAAAKAKVKAEPKEKAQNPCECACGGVTGGRFCPGHDARYYGWLQKVTDGRMEWKELPKVVQKRLVDAKGLKAALAAHKKH